jgi:hypothetical protein
VSSTQTQAAITYPSTPVKKRHFPWRRNSVRAWRCCGYQRGVFVVLINCAVDCLQAYTGCAKSPIQLEQQLEAVQRHTGSRVSSGSIVSGYGLDDRAIGVRSPAGAKDFSSNLCVQTGSGVHPASCTMGTGGPFPGGKSAAGA